MSVLEKMEVAPIVREVIQGSLPQGQEMRHLAMIYRVVGPEWNLQWQDVFVAVSDHFVAFRGLSWESSPTPQILWSQDCLITEFGFHQYSEMECIEEVAVLFANRGHQTQRFAEADLSMNGLEFTACTFYSDLRDIYEFVRVKKLQSVTQAGALGAISKCPSCGSTELTVSGPYIVCDYCKSKVVR